MYTRSRRRRVPRPLLGTPKPFWVTRVMEEVLKRALLATLRSTDAASPKKRPRTSENSVVHFKFFEGKFGDSHSFKTADFRGVKTHDLGAPIVRGCEPGTSWRDVSLSSWKEISEVRKRLRIVYTRRGEKVPLMSLVH